MSRTIFLAGASGAIGRRLVPILVAGGWRVIGMTRSAGKQALLADLGASPLVLDVFDAPGVQRAIAESRPDVIVQQLTDSPPGLEPSQMEEAVPRNARIRDEGTRNLVVAAVATGVRRFVAQSIAFACPSSQEQPIVRRPIAAELDALSPASRHG